MAGTTGKTLYLCAQASALVAAYPVACPNGICPGLGRTFYLPDADALTNGGRPFATNAKINECSTVKNVSVSTRTMVVSNSMKELVQNTNHDFSLSGGFPVEALTVKGSLSVITGYSSDIQSSFHSSHLDVSYVTQEVAFDRTSTCYGSEAHIEPQWLESFKALPEIETNAVVESSSWAPYVNFLKDQGSHMMVEQSIGSRFQQWESSTSESSDISKLLQIKACVDVEGLAAKITGWSVNSCANYSSSEKKQAESTSSNSKRIILGGTPATRIALLTRFGNDTLDAFIASAPSGDHPVSYGFVPVWEMLVDVYAVLCHENAADCKQLQRAYNLQAAYEGWLAVGCPKLETNNGVVYQQMAIADPSAPIKTYQCDAAKTGCYSDHDCHQDVGCYCYGDSCLDAGDTVLGTASQRDKVIGSKSGSLYHGVNQACHWDWECVCDSSWSGGLPARKLYAQNAQALNGFRNSSRVHTPMSISV